MVSQHRNRNAPAAEARKAANAIDEEHILDAAYELLLAVGMRRMTMADIARKADVSRATLYRRWGSVREVVAALMTREWSRLEAAEPSADDGDGSARQLLVRGVVRMVRASRTHPMLRKIIDVDPEFLLPYLLRRQGANTRRQLEVIEHGLKAGMADGSIRPGDVAMQAKSVLLTAWSFALTGPAFVEVPGGEGPELDALDEQLRELLERYLTP